MSRLILLIALIFLLPGCQGGSAVVTATGSAPQNAVTIKSLSENNNMDVKNDGTVSSALSPPSSDEVMRVLYGAQGRGDNGAYALDDGSTAVYWYGHEYMVGEKQYFTGFAYTTKPTYGKDDVAAYPGPDDQVDMAQATFVQDEAGGRKSWSLVGSEPFIGKLGGYDKIDSMDTHRSSATYTTPAGKYILAIPGTDMAGGGVTMELYEVFVMEEDMRWKYAGEIVSGEDNEAGCLPDSGYACVKTTGELEFETRPGADMPALRVVTQGQKAGRDGMAHPSGQTSMYEFDAASGSYKKIVN